LAKLIFSAHFAAGPVFYSIASDSAYIFTRSKTINLKKCALQSRRQAGKIAITIIHAGLNPIHLGLTAALA